MPATDVVTDPNPATGLSPEQQRWVAPLEGFLPGFVGGSDWRWLQPGELPPAERGLLAHDHDMTPTLAEHHASDIDLEVRRCELEGDVLRRLVVLHRRSDGRSVEVGAITILLSGFDEPVRRAIEDGGEPLGGILCRSGLPHSSHPRAFFSCDSAAVNERLGGLRAAVPPQATRAHGRCNELRHADGQVFAEIVEILPPVTAH
jgi:hypothetical protein